MRQWINLFESATPTYFHGSRKDFPDGFILQPQSDGYILAMRDDDAAHAMMGREWYPDWEEPEAREYALNYWNAVPRENGDDLIEILCKSARILSKEK